MRVGSWTSATCSTGRSSPRGDVVVIDEIGFHHATSVAELLADRGCQVEVITPGMVVGQDLGITLDMENWWIRAGAKGIVQTTDCVPMSVGEPAASGPAAVQTLHLQHHPTGTVRERSPDWCVLAVPSEPADELYHELRSGGVDVHRVGDAIAPRRGARSGHRRRAGRGVDRLVGPRQRSGLTPDS